MKDKNLTARVEGKKLTLRVRASTHNYIKVEAAKRGVTMDSFLDEVISAFKHCEAKALAEVNEARAGITKEQKAVELLKKAHPIVCFAVGAHEDAGLLYRDMCGYFKEGNNDE